MQKIDSQSTAPRLILALGCLFIAAISLTFHSAAAQTPEQDQAVQPAGEPAKTEPQTAPETLPTETPQTEPVTIDSNLLIKQLETLRNDFQNTKPGDERTLKLDEFVAQSLQVSTTLNNHLLFDEALRAINLAIPIATQTKSERANELVELAKEVRRRRTIRLRLEPQVDRLKKNKTDQALARTLVEAYVLELDAIPQAKQIASEAQDQTTLARLEFVDKDPIDLTTAQALDLGDWFYQLSQKHGPTKALATGRALQNYEAAVMTGIDDEKTKKRVELLIKTLQSKETNNLDISKDASKDKHDISVEGNASLYRLLHSLSQPFRPTGQPALFTEAQRTTVKPHLERLFFRGKISSFRGRPTNIRVSYSQADTKTLYASVEFETRYMLRVRVSFRSPIKSNEADLIRQTSLVVVRGPIESISIGNITSTIYINLGESKVQLSK